MKIYDPEEDNDYTDTCDYCNARLVIYPSDLDCSQLISEDNSFDLVCPACGGQIRLTMDPTIGPLPECFDECGDIWHKHYERKCPCDKVMPPEQLKRARQFMQESEEWAYTPQRLFEIIKATSTPSDQISHPSHYPEGSYSNIEKIVDGLPAAKAVALANVLKYAIRAGRKEGESLEKDLGKARNYAHRLVTGKWIWEDTQSEEDEYE